MKLFSNNFYRGLLFILSIGVISIITGCSRGGGGGIAITPEDTKEGVFLDSAVEGLQFSTISWTGFTDTQGRFTYQEGENISFSIGDVTLGRVPAKAIITPLDLAAGATDAHNPIVSNFSRFLQSLDVDGNPGNGIKISDEIRQALTGINVDFTDPDFGNNPDVQTLFNKLNELGIYPEEVRTLVSAEEAEIHLEETLIDNGLQDVSITASIDKPSAEMTIIQGDFVDFQGSSTSGNPPYFYVWNFAGGAPDSTKEDPGVLLFNTPGTYKVLFSATDSNGDTANDSVTITVIAGEPDIEPVAIISSPCSSTYTIDEGDIVKFEGAVYSGNAPFKYLWNFNGVADDSTLKDPGDIIFNTHGAYIVSFTVTDKEEVSYVDSVIIYVLQNTLPVIKITSPLSPSTEIEIGDTINFQSKILSGNAPFTFKWDFKGGAAVNSTVQNPENVPFTRVGTYDVTVTVTDKQGETASDSLTVIVNQ